jgi:hypothetical protein
MSQPNRGVKFVVGSLLGVIVGLALATTISLPAISAGNGASKWQVWSYNPSNRALRGSISADANAGIATFAFPATPDVALLVTDHGSYKGSLLGDLTGRTVSASVSAAGGPFTYFGQGSPQNPCGTPANVRLFFQTKSSGSFAETDYWWSNPVSLTLALIPSATPMSAPLTGANWSDYFGHFGNDPQFAAAFADAVKNVTSIGLSFGGGCFFENGVGAPNGGLFTLWNFTAN